MEPEQKRMKVSYVADAEALAWRQGIAVAKHMKETFLKVRHTLLEIGYPSGHALCEELDKGAEKWAGHEEQMRRDYLKHCDENAIQPSPAKDLSV